MFRSSRQMPLRLDATEGFGVIVDGYARQRTEPRMRLRKNVVGW